MLWAVCLVQIAGLVGKIEPPLVGTRLSRRLSAYLLSAAVWMQARIGFFRVSCMHIYTVGCHTGAIRARIVASRE